MTASEHSTDTRHAMDVEAIRRLLPHHYPFLMVDRVLEGSPGKDVLAVKNVTVNEPYFQGHFPEKAIMPGVLIIEAMAQVSALLGCITLREHPSEDVRFLHLLATVDQARFRRPVVPGDVLLLQSRLSARRSSAWKFATEAHVDEQLVARANLLMTLSG